MNDLNAVILSQFDKSAEIINNSIKLDNLSERTPKHYESHGSVLLPRIFEQCALKIGSNTLSMFKYIKALSAHSSVGLINNFFSYTHICIGGID